MGVGNYWELVKWESSQMRVGKAGVDQTRVGQMVPNHSVCPRTIMTTPAMVMTWPIIVKWTPPQLIPLQNVSLMPSQIYHITYHISGWLRDQQNVDSFRKIWTTSQRWNNEEPWNIFHLQKFGISFFWFWKLYTRAHPMGSAAHKVLLASFLYLPHVLFLGLCSV